jgi:O-antigen ligase
MLVGQRKTKYCRATVLIFFGLCLHFLLLLGYANPEQIQRVLALSVEDGPYVETKLAGILVFNSMPVLMGFVLSKVAVRQDFRDGMVVSMVTWAAIALVVGAYYSEYLFSPTPSLVEEWRGLPRFSTIGMTLVIMGGFLAGLVYFLNGRRRVLSFFLLLFTFVLLVAYRQRAAWVYSLLAALFLVGRGAAVKPSRGVKAALGAVSAILVGILVANEIGALSVQVLGRAETILEGRLLDSRAPLFLAAIRGFWENPLGQGLGSFATGGNGDVYPHNVLLEALYELGLVGGFVILLILGSLLNSILRLVREENRDLASLILGLYLGYVFVYNLKSGDLASTELLFSVTLLFSCARFGARKGGGPAEKGHQVALE